MVPCGYIPDKGKILFMACLHSSKLVVWIFCGQSTVPPLRFSLDGSAHIQISEEDRTLQYITSHLILC